MANRDSGLEVVPTEEDDTFNGMKAVVRKGSKAYEKGIRTGDYLISANDIPITCQCNYMLLTRQERVKRYVFRSPEEEVKEVEW